MWEYFGFIGYVMYTMYTLLIWSIIYALSYTTKVWYILWIFIGLSIISHIYSYATTEDKSKFNMIFPIISLLIQGMFLYISYNLYINPKESYTYVKVISNSNSNKTKTKE
jgi:hypothetical protein